MVPFSVADPGCLSRIRTYSIPDPRSEYFHPGSRICIKEFKYFNPKIVSKFYEIWSVLFILDPRSGSLLLPAPDPGSGSPNTGAVEGTSMWMLGLNMVPIKEGAGRCLNRINWYLEEGWRVIILVNVWYRWRYSISVCLMYKRYQWGSVNILCASVDGTRERQDAIIFLNGW